MLIREPLRLIPVILYRREDLATIWAAVYYLSFFIGHILT